MIDTFFAPLAAGFASIANFWTLLYVCFGVAVGYAVGAIPGLGKGTATAILIPVTFYLEPVSAIGLLIGIAKGSTAGSAISAILMNTPGEPSSAATAFDGYPLAQQGKAGKALKMGLYASVIGDLISTLCLIALAAPLAQFALEIGPVEQFAILLFSLTFIGALAGNSLVKGLISGTLGLLVATVGMEIETAVPRFTFGRLELFDGLSLIPVAIGMMAVSEMVLQMANHRELDRQVAEIRVSSDPDDSRVTGREWRRCLPVILRGTGIGVFVGILPGLGASVASFMSYGTTARMSKTPERFGKGAIEGVAASESADNAVVPSSFVPLFALGIPGSVIAAILISAFVIHGITPGPLMFVEDAEIVQSLYAAMIVASFALLAIGLIGQSFFAWVIRSPMRVIAPAVLFFCMIGSFMQGGGLFGIGVMVIFAVFGVLAKKLDFSFVTFLIGFVIGPSLELTLRQTIPLLDRDVTNLAQHPIAAVFIGLTIALIAILALAEIRRRTRAVLALSEGSVAFNETGRNS